MLGELVDRLDRAEVENRQLRRMVALLRSGIDPDSQYVEGVVEGMNIRVVCEDTWKELEQEAA